MLQSLARRDAIVWVVDKQLLNEVYSFWAHMRDKLWDPCPLGHMRKVEFHVGSVLLKLLEELLGRGSHDVMNFDNLIELVVSREEREERKNLKENAAHTPEVHLVSVVAVC